MILYNTTASSLFVRIRILSYANIDMMMYICICLSMLNFHKNCIVSTFFIETVTEQNIFSEIFKTFYRCIIQFITNYWITDIQITTRCNMV